jgi:hypothetical protein
MTVLVLSIVERIEPTDYQGRKVALICTQRGCHAKASGGRCDTHEAEHLELQRRSAARRRRMERAQLSLLSTIQI